MNNCRCETVTTSIWVASYRAAQGPSLLHNVFVEIMGASGCPIVFSKNGAKCMYFLLDKKNKMLTRFFEIYFLTKLRL